VIGASLGCVFTRFFVYCVWQWCLWVIYLYCSVKEYKTILRIYFVTHIFIGSSALNVSIYSENRRGIYFSPQKRLKHGQQNTTLHWINGIIRNNKCIFTKLNAVFNNQNGCMNKKILQRLIPSQIPDRFSKFLCSTAVP
jgi:hypothetical protein